MIKLRWMCKDVDLSPLCCWKANCSVNHELDLRVVSSKRNFLETNQESISLYSSQRILCTHYTLSWHDKYAQIPCTLFRTGPSLRIQSDVL